MFLADTCVLCFKCISFIHNSFAHSSLTQSAFVPGPHYQRLRMQRYQGASTDQQHPNPSDNAQETAGNDSAHGRASESQLRDSRRRSFPLQTHRHTAYPFHQTAQSFLSPILNLNLCPQAKIPAREDCPGGPVVKSPVARAGDMGSSPGPERSHMSGSN